MELNTKTNSNTDTKKLSEITASSKKEKEKKPKLSEEVSNQPNEETNSQKKKKKKKKKKNSKPNLVPPFESNINSLFDFPSLGSKDFETSNVSSQNTLTNLVDFPVSPEKVTSDSVSVISVFSSISNSKTQSKSKKKKPEPITLDGFLLKPKKEKIHSSSSVNSDKPAKQVPKKKKSSLVPNPNSISSQSFVKLKGKDTLVPKPKKLSKMKKIILMEREKNLRSSNQIPEELFKEINELETKRLNDKSDSTKDSKVISSYSKAYFETLSKLPKPGNPSFVREYCLQDITSELKNIVEELLITLRNFQSRLRALNPQKAKAKRRLISGFRETIRSLESNKIKCVIMAPNIDEIRSPGGLNDAIQKILKLARKKNVEVVYALRKNRLGRAMGKKHKLSIVGIRDYDGANELFNKMLQLARQGRKSYSNRMKQEKETAEQRKKEEEQKQIIFSHIFENANLLTPENKEFIEKIEFIWKVNSIPPLEEECSEATYLTESQKKETLIKRNVRYIPLNYSKVVLPTAIQEIQTFLEINFENQTWNKIQRKLDWPRLSLLSNQERINQENQKVLGFENQLDEDIIEVEEDAHSSSEEEEFIQENKLDEPKINFEQTNFKEKASEIQKESNSFN